MSRKSIAKSPVEVKEKSRPLAPLSLSVHGIKIEAMHLGQLGKIRDAVEQLPEECRQYVEAVREHHWTGGDGFKISYQGAWYLPGMGEVTDFISDHFASSLGYE